VPAGRPQAALAINRRLLVTGPHGGFQPPQTEIVSAAKSDRGPRSIRQAVGNIRRAGPNRTRTRRYARAGAAPRARQQHTSTQESYDQKLLVARTRGKGRNLLDQASIRCHVSWPTEPPTLTTDHRPGQATSASNATAAKAIKHGKPPPATAPHESAAPANPPTARTTEIPDCWSPAR